MKLSTLVVRPELYIVAERFVKSNDTVHLQLSIVDHGNVNICLKGQVCAIGISHEAKDIRYFREIRRNISAVVSDFTGAIAQHPDYQCIFIDEDTIIAFILGGIFDSY